ncbi:MAG: hypothetical protein DRP93_04710, partial [Candidatus Neomarinimicrobiota bacterium]
TNSNGESAPVILYIQLNNIVDIPVATSFTGNRVFDNANAGDTIGTITFNQGASPVTSISLLGEGSQYFNINLQGNITVGANGFTLLNETQNDHRDKSTFSLEVIAENDLGQSLPARLSLEVYHINATPILMKLTTSIDENASASSIVDTIRFNEGTSQIISFALSGIGSENFIVDNSGVISLSDTASLDHESISSYNLTASANNQIGTGNTANIYIRINNSPDVPELKSNMQFNVDENATVGTIIGNIVKSEGVSAITKITLKSYSNLYDINDIFEVDLNGNVRLKTEDILDYESMRYYYFTATAINIDGQSIARYYSVYINNSYDVPELKGLSGSIYENAPAGTFIGNILAHSGSSDITSFTLSGNGNENFEIDLNGNITVSATANLNYEDLIYYYLNATATNAEGSKTQSVTIKLTDILDAPLLKSFSGFINENSVEGSVVGQVEIIQGASSTISTSLTGSGNEDFTIDINGTIQVAVGVSIDYEKRQSYSFYATATNVQGPSLAAYVRITVKDMPDVPNVQSFSAYVNENATAGTILGSVNFNEGASPITALEFSGAGSELFDIDLTGLVTVSTGTTFDYDQGIRAYSFSVTATNALGESLPQSIFIYVNDILDAPQISNFSADVNENVPIGTQVGRLNINEGLSPLLSIDLSRSGSELFSVDINGTIKTVGNFDYDVEDYYVLSVTATNSNGTSVASGVRIRINDIANYPKIEDFTADINENSSASTHIGKLELINGIVPITSFNLYGTGSELFNVDVDGNIFLKKNTLLDYERQSLYSFAIVGSRNLRVEGTAYEIVTQRFYAKIEIKVSDIIDVAVLKEFSASVTENSGKGITVGNVEIISNGDTPVRSMTLSGVGSDEFVIDVDGLISLRNDLSFDYERQQDYNMSVVAHTDNGDSEAQAINIVVSNSLDAPTYLNFSDEISEDADSNTIIGQIPSLSLKDTTPTSIQLSGEGSEHFLVDATGVIRVADVQLDFETKNFYTLKAKASTQYGDSNEVDVTIEVIDVDEYAEAGLGRWGDASVKIYKIEDNATKTLKFSETTSIGSDVNATGVFASHRLELEQDSFYIYEVSGGEDYDANNDGVLDITPTANKGIIHAVIKGSWVRHINWRPRVNLMSEVYYQQAAKYINNLEAFATKLLYPSRHINKDLNENHVSNAIDALIYNPVINIGAWDSYIFPKRSLEYIKEQIYENNPSYTLFLSNSFMYPSYTDNGDVVLSNDKNKMFSVDNDNGLRLIDISDLNNPVITNIMSESMELITISADNQHLFIKSYERWNDLLRIIDISDILNPTIVSSTSVPKFNNMQLSKDGTKLYITLQDYNTNSNGLGIIDISDIT